MTLWHDVRDAARQLRRSPGFTAAAVLSLALGIGANTAIFTLLDQVLLRPLPVAQPEQLVMLDWEGPKVGITMFGNSISYPAYRDLRDRNTVFSGIMCRYPLPLSVSAGSSVESGVESGAGRQTGNGAGAPNGTALIAGELVSGNYFDVLGVKPAIGRLFTPDDNRVPGGHPIAVLSYDYWVAQFNADPTIVGRTLIVDGVPLTIVGVSQRGFDGVELGFSPKVRVPLMMKAQMTQGYFAQSVTIENRRVYWVHPIARLKPGVTATQAEAALQPLFHAMLQEELQGPGFEQQSADSKARFLRSTLHVLPRPQGLTSLQEAYEMPLRVLMAIVGLVVLIACANVANLLLERALRRRRDIAVRLALGATMWQIVRRMLVESLVLALAGGAAGLLLALWVSQALVSFVPTEFDPLNLRTTPDLRILLFTLALCVSTGVLFGLAPAMASRPIELTPSLKPDARGMTGGHGRLRQILVIAQVALSVLLLIGAAQFLRTLVNLRQIDLGLRTAQVTTFSINPSLNGYGKARSRTFYRAFLERARAVPGVASLSATALPVLSQAWWSDGVSVEGGAQTGGDRVQPNFNLVSTDHLATLGIPLIAGRAFTAADGTAKQRVALVNEAFARQYFNGANPVGKRLAMGTGVNITLDIEIVGLMKDSKYGLVRERIRPQVFLDNDQNDDIQQINVYVKSALDAGQVHAMMRQVVQAIDPNVPLFNVRTLDDQAGRTMAGERMVASLAAAFGLLATLVAAVGIYALMAFSVTGRTREIGVRLALGARSSHVLWLVMREVLALVAIGIVLALPAAWAASRVVQSQLYGVAPQDAISTIAAAGILAAVAALAGFIPARRATIINPTHALRSE